jgi:hypothetical protein
MPFPQHLLADLQGLFTRLQGGAVLPFPVERNRLRVQPSRFAQEPASVPAQRGLLFEDGQVQAGVGRLPVTFAVAFLLEGQDFPQGRAGGGVVLALDMHPDQPAQGGKDVGVRLPEHFPFDGQHPLGRGNRLGEVAPGAQPLGLLPVAVPLLEPLLAGVLARAPVGGRGRAPCPRTRHDRRQRQQ